MPCLTCMQLPCPPLQQQQQRVSVRFPKQAALFFLTFDHGTDVNVGRVYINGKLSAKAVLLFLLLVVNQKSLSFSCHHDGCRSPKDGKRKEERSVPNG